MAARRPSNPALLASALALGALAALAAPREALASFVAVGDSTNPIVAATVSGTYTGTAWVDADDDGLLDLFIVRKGQMFRNLGGGVFEIVPGAVPGQGRPQGTTWSDYDNDGDIDCFTSGGPWVDKGSHLYRNDGDFQFHRVSASEGGDAGNVVDNTGWGCAFGDLDNDGYTDIVIAAANGFGGVTHENVLLLNDGDGSFTSDDTTPITMGLDAYTVPTWSDYDFDGDSDLFIGSGEISVLSPDNLYRNLFEETGSFGFERITTAPIATDSLDGQVWNWIDYDNDGDLDAFQTNYNFNLFNNLYRNDGGTYVKMTASDVGDIVNSTGLSLTNLWTDFDNDGDLDCLVTKDGVAKNEYWVNNGDGTFSGDSLSAVALENGPHYGASAGDWDNDGDVDLYINGTTATKRLYRNDNANGNSWLNIKLRGAGAPHSNRSAIGAKVRALATIGGQPVWQFREVLAQNSFCSMNMLNVHFGLGDATGIDSLIVEWPAGGTDVQTNVSVDQFVEILEGAALGVEVLPVRFGELRLRSAPNPFSRETTVEFALPQASDVALRVFDIAGREVRDLASGRREAGVHRVEWDARDRSSRRLASGVYFYRLEALGQVAARKVVIVD